MLSSFLLRVNDTCFGFLDMAEIVQYTFFKILLQYYTRLKVAPNQIVWPKKVAKKYLK